MLICLVFVVTVYLKRRAGEIADPEAIVIVRFAFREICNKDRGGSSETMSVDTRFPGGSSIGAFIAPGGFAVDTMSDTRRGIKLNMLSMENGNTSRNPATAHRQ